MNIQSCQRKGLLLVFGVLIFLGTACTLVYSFRWINRPFPGFLLYSNLSVAPDFLPEWNGRIAGLKFLDRVLTIQDLPVTDRQFLLELVRSHPAGTSFHYTFERAGQTFRATIPSMSFSFHDWLLSFGSYIITGLGFMVIGFGPFYLRSSSPAAAALFFMVSAIFVWFTSTFDFLTEGIFPKELRILAFTLTPSAGIHLGLLLTENYGRRKRHSLYVASIYGISILLALAYGLTFNGPMEVWVFVLRLAYGYSCVAAIIFLAVLWSALKHSLSNLERSRLRVVGFGAVLGFFLPTLGTVLVSHFGLGLPYNLLLIPTVFFPLSVAYALLKYSLFDFDAVLKLGLTRAALMGVLLLVYVLVVSVLGVSFGIYGKDSLVPLLFSILVVILFNPLLRWIEGFVDRYLYRREYDPIKLQNNVSLTLRSLARPQAVAERFVKLIVDHVALERCCLFFRPRNEEKYLGILVEEELPEGEEILHTLESLWSHYLDTDRKALSWEELETDPLYAADRGVLANILKVLKSELVIPVVFEGVIFGFVSFGKKRSGRNLSGDDFRLFCNLTDQLALSLKNGMLFEESEQAKESYHRLYDDSQMINRRLVETDQVKKQFVANICHELRTPISTILGYIEVLLDPAFAGDHRAILERVVLNSQNLSQLMDSLLNFSRLESGSLATNLQQVNIREMLQSFNMMAQRLIKSRPIRVRVGVASSPVEIIETDPNKLQQILMQLLTNAFKFTERGEIVLQVHRISQGGDFVEIAVSDTGIGIGKQDQEIIFEEFRQLDGSSTRQYGGTGLGLNLCRRLAESLGGRIQVESELGKGSTFSLLLPLSGPRMTLAA
ncbi:MAG TPA: GAF domain-containing sensor histidine kinase [Candidatus Binatia bacterium]|nr:GAF domain-containing sensor histidine kinase [Candidatus Binatia bacterium]